MEKTKKVINGRGLEVFLLLRMLPVAALIAADVFALYFQKPLQYTVIGFPVNVYTLCGVFLCAEFVAWYFFLFEVWRGLFPARRILPFFWFFAWVPVIGSLFMYPAALLIPAEKREDRAVFRWCLLQILMTILLQVVLVWHTAIPHWYAYGPALLTLLTGFKASRLLAGRRPASSVTWICALLFLGYLTWFIWYFTVRLHVF